MSEDKPEREPTLADTRDNLMRINELSHTLIQEANTIHAMLDQDVYSDMKTPATAEKEVTQKAQNLRFDMHKISKEAIMALETVYKSLDSLKWKFHTKQTEQNSRR